MSFDSLPTKRWYLLTEHLVLLHLGFDWLQEWTIDLTGQTCPSKRASLWKSKRVFFVTPQVLEKDIQSGDALILLLSKHPELIMSSYTFRNVSYQLLGLFGDRRGPSSFRELFLLCCSSWGLFAYLLYLVQSLCVSLFFTLIKIKVPY